MAVTVRGPPPHVHRQNLRDLPANLERNDRSQAFPDRALRVRADVGLAVKLARAEKMQVSVRGGGHGLATTGGQVSHTGIAGLTLGGGLGYLMGKHGAVCDNLLSVEMVMADGEMLTANMDQNSDLFWAVRGAGANFGVVTSFRYRLHPLGQVLAGLLLHPRDRAVELIAFHREFLAGTPDELDTTIGFL